MRRIGAQAVGDVEHRRRLIAEPKPLLCADRRANVPLLAKRGARGAERTGDHDDVARTGSGAARHALGAAERRHAHDDLVRAGRVAPDDRHSRLGDPLVELEHPRDLDIAGSRERDEERLRPRRRSREVADVHRGGPEAELPPGEPVEPEVHALDERVLGDDEPAGELGRIVLDPDDQAARLQLPQEPDLSRVREQHRQPRAALRSPRSPE